MQDFTTATSGKIIEPKRIRTFPVEKIKFKGRCLERLTSRASNISSSDEGPFCEKWGMVMTIFEPSEAVRRFAKMEEWCLVIVGDKKGPHEYQLDDVDVEKTILLSAKDQEAMGSNF